MFTPSQIETEKKVLIVSPCQALHSHLELLESLLSTRPHWDWHYLRHIEKKNFLDALASLGSMLESE